MRWKGIGEGTTEVGGNIWYSGHERKCVHGAGFLVNKKVSKCVIDFLPVSKRIKTISRKKINEGARRLEHKDWKRCL